MEKHCYHSFIRRLLESEENKRLVAKLILHLYHETVTPKQQKITAVFPAFLLNQITVYNELITLVDYLAIGHKTLYISNESFHLSAFYYFTVFKKQTVKKWDDYEVVLDKN